MIQVAKPSITELEKKYVKEAMDTGMVSCLGPHVKEFERKWAEYNDMKYGISCSSGTNALFLALKAMGIGKGDEVIIPNFTMIATAYAVEYTGATSVIVDSSLHDLNIDVDLIESAITENTKAIIPVHIYGRKCDMDAINKLAYEYNIYVVEDSAEAHGIKPTGDVACFSLFANKIITAGEGGICVTNNERLARQIDHLKNMAFDPEHTFMHKKIAYNYRMSNLQGALALAQTERIDEMLKKRRLIEKWYSKKISKEYQSTKRDVVWFYDVRLAHQTLAREVRKKLREKGVESREFFKSISSQPPFKCEENHWHKTDHIAGIYLPTYFDMTEKDVDMVVKAFHDSV